MLARRWTRRAVGVAAVAGQKVPDRASPTEPSSPSASGSTDERGGCGRGLRRGAHTAAASHQTPSGHVGKTWRLLPDSHRKTTT